LIESLGTADRPGAVASAVNLQNSTTTKKALELSFVVVTVRLFTCTLVLLFARRYLTSAVVVCLSGRFHFSNQ
jgi:hypothetical protein